MSHRPSAFATRAELPMTEPVEDSNVLSFGSSATVNTDLKKEIEKEIKSINSKLLKTKKEIDSELKTHNELCKGQLHADMENQSLLFESTQSLQTLKVGEDVLQRFKTTMDTEFGLQFNLQDSDGRSFQAKTGASRGENLMPTRKSVDEVAKSKAEMDSLLHHLQTTIENEASQLRALKAKEDELEVGMEATSKRVGELERRWIEQQKRIQEDQKLLDNELNRQKMLIVKKDKLAKELEEFEKVTAKKTKELKDQKERHMAEENAKRQSIAATNERIAIKTKKLQDMDAEISKIREQKAVADAQLQEAQALIAQRTNYENEIQKVREERSKLFTEDRELSAAIAAVQAELEKAEAAVLVQEVAKAEIAALKESNDKLEREKYLPALKEAEAVAQELEAIRALAKSIKSDTEKEKAAMGKKHDEAVENLESLKVELAAAKEQNQAKQSELEKCQGELDDYLSSYQLLKQLQDESVTQRNEIAEMEKAQARRRADLTRADLDRKLYILRKGAALLEHTSKKERELENM